MVRSLIVAVSLAALVGCENKNEPAPAPAPSTTSTAPAVPGLPADAGKTIGDAGADMKTRLVSSLESGLNSAKAELEALRAKVATATQEKKPEMQALLDKAETSYEKLKTDLAALKADAGSQWDKLSAEAKLSLDNVKSTISEFTAKYK
jgi:capsule polysaccharide export protein KpsE/RkpR